MLWQLLLVAGTSVTLAEPAADEPRAAERPNIVYILLDDAGYGDLSCYGQARFQTPHSDRLAREGMKFTQHYSGSTVCAPTRSVLMTGRHTGRTHVRGNREIQPEGQQPLPAGIVTLPKLLQAAGYATGAFGKWGLGPPGSEGDPLQQGFDTFFGYNCQRHAHTYYPDYLWHDDYRVPLDGHTYSHDLIVQQALRFIREHREGPFFCYLPVAIPHAAMHVPAPYHDPFREQFPQFEDTIGTYRGPDVRNPIAAFAGMMTKMDEDVGRVLALLDELGIDERTLVILTSDNGPHQEGGHDPEFFNSSGGLRGLKRDLYEGGVRVPMLARWPGRIEPGMTTDHVSAQWDILPTLCELAGIEPPTDIDGLSLVPTLLGRPDEQLEHEYLYWEFYERGGRRAVRFGPWKAVQLDVHDDFDGPVELYNLDVDPGEQRDLAESRPELVAKARQLFVDAHEPSELWQFRSLARP